VLFPAGADGARPTTGTTVAEADARLAREAAETAASNSKYGELSAYLRSSLAREQTEPAAEATDYLDDDAVAGATEAVQLEMVRQSVEDERKKLAPLRAARKLAQERRKETRADRVELCGFSEEWLERHGQRRTAEEASTELAELDLELHKEDLLLQQDRQRLEVGGVGGGDSSALPLGSPRAALPEDLDELLKQEDLLLQQDLQRRRTSQSSS